MIPTLYTPRLILRPFTLADALRVQELAGDARVAQTTALIPHPYPDGAAETWITAQETGAKEGGKYTFAITLAGTRTPGRELDPADTGHVIGAIDVAAQEQRAVLGYWMGVPYWNKGFMTEAAHAVVSFAFARLGAARVEAWHLAGNEASGRVMEKIGMTRLDGSRSTEKNGRAVELVDYALTREAWSRRRIVHRWKPAPPRALTPA